MTGITLRGYQREAIDRTQAAEARGVRAQLGVAATGSGKTTVFTWLAKERGGRTLILAHRDELVTQAADRVREIWPEAEIGIVKADRNDIDAHVIVGSVQTLSKDKRLAQLTEETSLLFGQPDPFDLVIVDEAHHSAADTYRKIIDRLGAGQPDGPLLLGVTATPDRGDGEGLDEIFDEIVWSYDMLWCIRAGFLCDVRGLRVTIPKLDLSKVKMSRGDYQVGAAGIALIDADAPAEIVKAWLEHASDRQTLVFTPTVASAEAVQSAFVDAGVRASMVSGELDTDTRRARLKAYAAGSIQVMVNCMVLTEGYDDPRTDCIVMARPTKSRALYTQCVGRGTRRHPAKTDLLVLDCVGVTDELNLVTVPSLFGVPNDFQGAEGLGDGTGTATGILDQYDDHLVQIGEMRAEQAVMFKKIRGEGIAWVPVGDKGEMFVCGMGDAGSVRVILNAAEQWAATWAGPKDQGERMETLIVSPTLDSALGVAEDYVRAHGPRGLVDASAKWRGAKPSQKQVGLAAKLGIEWVGMSKGELSDAITAVLEARKAKR